MWAIPLLAATANRPAVDLRIADTLMSASGAVVHPGANDDACYRAFTCSNEFPALCDARPRLRNRGDSYITDNTSGFIMMMKETESGGPPEICTYNFVDSI
jgi:hypothetical protein